VEYVTFGGTGLGVSRIALGTWQLGGDWGPTDEVTAIAAIKRGRELGVNFFDTAQGYGWGASERLLGRALRDDLDHRRNEVVIATKGGLNLSGAELRRDSSPQWLRRGVERSLEALGVDYIDIYQVHWPDSNVRFSDTAEALQDLVDSGLIRHVGVSNFNVREMEDFAKTRPVETLQPPLNLLRREVEDEILPHCQRKNIGVFVYGPLAHGLLSGALAHDTQFTAGDWRAVYPEFQGEVFRRNLGLIERLSSYAREHLDCSLSELAIAWVLSRPGVQAAIVGTRSAEHLAQAVHAAELALTENDLRAIDEILAASVPLRGITPESF
jgi:aryl-alcohol dehydrogenase-like predicted oxidoreductase